MSTQLIVGIVIAIFAVFAAIVLLVSSRKHKLDDAFESVVPPLIDTCTGKDTTISVPTPEQPTELKPGESVLVQQAAPVVVSVPGVSLALDEPAKPAKSPRKRTAKKTEAKAKPKAKPATGSKAKTANTKKTAKPAKTTKKPAKTPKTKGAGKTKKALDVEAPW